MRRAVILQLVCCALAVAAVAEPSVSADVDQSEVTVDRPFVLRITAEGRISGEIRFPKDIEGLVIDSRPRQRFTSTVMSGSHWTAVDEQRFVVRAVTPGEHTIPPIEVTVDGVTVQTEAITVTAVSGESSRNEPAVARPRPQADVLTLDEVAFIASTVDKREVYEGEPIQLTLELGRIHMNRVHVEENFGRGLVPPSTEGFYAVPRLPVARPPDDVETRDGRPYRITRYQQTLYPMAPGTLTVGEWRWYGSARIVADRRMRYEDLALDAPAIEVTVRPLPQPRPEGFRGAVGSYRLHGEVDPDRVDLGTPARLLLRVVGSGNSDAVGDPVLPAIEGAHVGDPAKEVTRLNDPDGVAFEKSFAFNITPTQAGRIRIPTVSFVYFDPSRADYRTETVGPFDLEAVPSRRAEERVVVDSESPLAGEVDETELLPIVADPGVLAPRREHVLGTGLLAGAPALAYAMLAVIAVRRRRFTTDEGYARWRRARARARSRLDEVPESPEPAEVLYRALTGYLADKCGVPEAGMTSPDAARLLDARAVEANLVEGFMRIARACERARFASDALSSEEVDAMRHAAYLLVDRLEEAFREGAR